MAVDIHQYILDRISPEFMGVREEFRRVALDNGIPYIPAPVGERPFALRKLDVQISVCGYFAQTTLTMTFFNPNARPFEGNLEIPMPDGASVCGYAIDIDGTLVDGVIVSKQKARMVLESEIRQDVDPGIIEQVQGNIYRVRIYPLPERGTRTVRVSYSSYIEDHDGVGVYRLPLQYAQCLDKVSVQLDIDQPPSIPLLQSSTLSLKPMGDSVRWQAQRDFQKGELCEDILLRLPKTSPAHMMVEEDDQGGRFFYLRQRIEEVESESWSPDVLGVAWDASGSMLDQNKNLDVLRQLLTRWPHIHILLQVFHHQTEPARRFSPSEHEDLLSYLEQLPYDGGTRLDRLVLLDQGIDGWLFFSDAQSALGGMPDIGQKPIFSIQPHTSSNSALLRFISKKTGGRHILLGRGVSNAVHRIMMGPSMAVVQCNDGCADVHVQRGDKTIQIFGRCTHFGPRIDIYLQDIKISHEIDVHRARKGSLVARSWATKQCDQLGLEPEKNKDELLRLGRKHGIVTSNTSLIVLETLDQHLDHDIAPAVHRKAMFDMYVAHQKREKISAERQQKEHLDQITRLWKERVEWWKKKHVYPPKKKRQSFRRQEHSFRDSNVLYNIATPSLFRRMSDRLFSPRVAQEEAFDASFEASEECFYEMEASEDYEFPDEEDRSEPTIKQPKPASIQVQAWNPETPYLQLLRQAEKNNRYLVYLAQKKSYAQSPSFYLDCGDFFVKEGETETGIRVLSNLLELNIQSPPLMRMLGWRLQQAGRLDDAIEVFAKVLSIRNDEPQSHRDLALAHGERWEQQGKEADIHAAVKGLYHVVCHSWIRFPEIELIALMELNRLLHLSKKSGITIKESVDSRLIKHLDVDVRISMSWDADQVDIDLHVDEPTGEIANYSHRNTAIGGHVSRDFRDGYGPEEYILRRGYKGEYKIRAHYFASNQQSIVGPCTVIVHIFTNYGRKDEQRECLMLRLEESGADFIVGTITL